MLCYIIPLTPKWNNPMFPLVDSMLVNHRRLDCLVVLIDVDGIIMICLC